jgi:hypothetical protein
VDPLTLALNTTRPRAIFAAIAYGSWLQRALERDGNDLLASEAPELADLLERHLDTAVDPSLAVRAAVAHHYVNLFLLDKDWVRDHQTLIFPSEDSPLGEAAWGAYVIYTRPFDDVLSALREVYERSAELAGTPGHGFRWDTAPQSRLGEHLASFYWSGTTHSKTDFLRLSGARLQALSNATSSISWADRSPIFGSLKRHPEID